MVDPIKEKDRSMGGSATRNQEYLTKPVEFSGRIFSIFCHNLSVHCKRLQHVMGKICRKLAKGDFSVVEWKTNDKIARKLKTKISDLNQKTNELGRAINGPLPTKQLSENLGNLNKELESIMEMQQKISSNDSIDKKLRDELELTYKYCSSNMESLDHILKKQTQKEDAEVQEVGNINEASLISSVPKKALTAEKKRPKKSTPTTEIPRELGRASTSPPERIMTPERPIFGPKSEPESRKTPKAPVAKPFIAEKTSSVRHAPSKESALKSTSLRAPSSHRKILDTPPAPQSDEESSSTALILSRNQGNQPPKLTRRNEETMLFDKLIEIVRQDQMIVPGAPSPVLDSYVENVLKLLEELPQPETSKQWQLVKSTSSNPSFKILADMALYDLSVLKSSKVRELFEKLPRYKEALEAAPVEAKKIFEVSLPRTGGAIKSDQAGLLTSEIAETTGMKIEVVEESVLSSIERELKRHLPEVSKVSPNIAPVLTLAPSGNEVAQTYRKVIKPKTDVTQEQYEATIKSHLSTIASELKGFENKSFDDCTDIIRDVNKKFKEVKILCKDAKLKPEDFQKIKDEIKKCRGTLSEKEAMTLIKSNLQTLIKVTKNISEINKNLDKGQIKKEKQANKRSLFKADWSDAKIEFSLSAQKIVDSVERALPADFEKNDSYKYKELSDIISTIKKDLKVVSQTYEEPILDNNDLTVTLTPIKEEGQPEAVPVNNKTTPASKPLKGRINSSSGRSLIGLIKAVGTFALMTFSVFSINSMIKTEAEKAEREESIRITRILATPPPESFPHIFEATNVVIDVSKADERTSKPDKTMPINPGFSTIFPEEQFMERYYEDFLAVPEEALSQIDLQNLWLERYAPGMSGLTMIDGR